MFLRTGREQQHTRICPPLPISTGRKSDQKTNDVVRYTAKKTWGTISRSPNETVDPNFPPLTKKSPSSSTPMKMGSATTVATPAAKVSHKKNSWGQGREQNVIASIFKNIRP